MSRSLTISILAASCLALLAVVGIVVADNEGAERRLATDDGVRVEAPGTRVETDTDKTRIQAPGVDITVPKRDEN
jgi:hypothetical protein